MAFVLVDQSGGRVTPPEAEIFFLLISRLYWDSSSKLNVLYVRRSAPKLLHLPRRQFLVALTLLSEGDPVVRVL